MGMQRSISILPVPIVIFFYSGMALAQCPIERLLPPVGPNAGAFGTQVALHGEGVLVSDRSAATLCPIAFDCGTGAVYFFRVIDGQWERVQRILPHDAQAGDQFGAAMHLDGDRLIVGAGFADLAGR